MSIARRFERRHFSLVGTKTDNGCHGGFTPIRNGSSSTHTGSWNGIRRWSISVPSWFSIPSSTSTWVMVRRKKPSTSFPAIHTKGLHLVWEAIFLESCTSVTNEDCHGEIGPDESCRHVRLMQPGGCIEQWLWNTPRVMGEVAGIVGGRCLCFRSSLVAMIKDGDSFNREALLDSHNMILEPSNKLFHFLESPLVVVGRRMLQS